MKINFGNVAKEYAEFRNDLPDELLESLNRRGIRFENKTVVDLGCGTGVLTRVLHEAGASVIGVEPSFELIQEAKSIDQENGHSISYIHAFAESTSLQDKSCDIVTVLRAWHWFDTEKTLNEIKRILKKSGLLIIMDSGFTKKDKVVEDTLEIIKKHIRTVQPAGSKAEANQLINSFPVEWFKEWQQYQFDLQETYKFYYDVSFTNEEWCGRVESLSWLSACEAKERTAIINEIYKKLNEDYGEVIHQIEHSCHITVLRRG